MSVDTDIAELFSRIEALEANPVNDGIRFNILNVGGYLNIETTAIGGLGTAGFHFKADATNGPALFSMIEDVNGWGAFFLEAGGYSFNIDNTTPDIGGFPGVFTVNNAGAALNLFQIYEDGRIFMANLRTTVPAAGTGELYNSGGTVKIA